LAHDRFPQLSLPSPNLDVRETNGAHQVRCQVRKKFVALSPEEWVRQHLIYYLVYYKSYPVSRFAVEFSLVYGKTKRRADIVVIDKNRNPALVVECKAPDVELSQGVMDQVAKYNSVIGCKLLIISNGLKHFVVELFQEGNLLF